MKPPMKISRVLTLGGMLVASLTLLVSNNTQGQDKTSDPHVSSGVVVTAEPAKISVWDKTLHLSGAVVASHEAIISAEVPGQRLIAVNVDVGDYVDEGEVLASFDTEKLRAEEAEFKANLAQAVAHEKQTAADKIRALNLKGTGALSEQQISSYLFQEESAEAQVEQTRARLRSQELLIQHSQVKAPGAGTISERKATLGEIKNTGEELYRLILNDKIEWRGELAPEDIIAVRQGQKVEIELPDKSHATAHVRVVSPSLNVASRTATVYADIEDGSMALAGMYLTGNINIEHVSMLTVPAESVVIRDGHTYVFEALKDGNTTTAVMKEVAAGQTHGSKTAIISGIAENSSIVVHGAGFLNNGDVITISAASGTGNP